MYEIVELSNKIKKLIETNEEFISISYNVVEDRMEITATYKFFIDKDMVEIDQITDERFSHVFKAEIDGVLFTAFITQEEFKEWSKSRNKEGWQHELK